MTSGGEDHCRRKQAVPSPRRDSTAPTRPAAFGSGGAGTSMRWRAALLTEHGASIVPGQPERKEAERIWTGDVDASFGNLVQRIRR